MKQAKILVVDDDRRLRALLERYLSEQGFSVRSEANSAQMTRRLLMQPFDLIVLDWMLPDEDGLSICRRLSADKNSPPIIMLTAKGGEDDRISGFECGADDYLPKPFNPRELAARINAVLRRCPRVAAAAPHDNPATVCFGTFILNFTERCLYREQQLIRLSSGEFDLLKVLTQHAGSPLSRERLAHLLHGRDHAHDNRSIDIQISRLRRLLEDDPRHPRYLKTVWGLGYLFVLQEK
jgi:two-component system phosphate regulon response regulator OmpR